MKYYIVYNIKGKVIANGPSRRGVITEAYRLGGGVMLGQGDLEEGKLCIHLLTDISDTMLQNPCRRFDDITWQDRIKAKRRKELLYKVIAAVVIAMGVLTLVHFFGLHPLN